MINSLIRAEEPPEPFCVVKIGETFYARSSLWIKTSDKTARGIDKLEFINGRYYTNPDEPCYILNMSELIAQLSDAVLEAQNNKINPPSIFDIIEAW